LIAFAFSHSLGQEETRALQQTASLFVHVGGAEQRQARQVHRSLAIMPRAAMETGAAIIRLIWHGKPPMEGVMQNWLENWTNAKFCDVANLILGAFLFVSPWIFGFDAGTVSQNAYITGIAIAILAIAALAAFAVWEEWLNLIVGLWALVSPWVLGFQGTTAMTVHVIIGAAVAILAAIELWMMSQIPPRLTTGS
jgi:hypothetical protein